MAKLTLNPAPTFKAKVGIPVAGGEPVDVEFVFKHRTKDELDAFIESRKGKSDKETLLEMASGWELDDPFSAESVERLLQNYAGAGLAIYKAYIAELYGARIKN